MAALAGWGAFTADWIAPFGTIFLRLLLLVAVPLVAASLVSGVASLSSVQKLSRIGGRTFLIYIGTTVIALIIGLSVVNILQPGNTIPESLRTRLQETYQGDTQARQAAAADAAARGPLQPLVDLVPENILGAASDNRNMLNVVFVSLLFGTALMLIPRREARPLMWVFESLNATVVKVVELIIHFAPIGVFALMAGTITSVVGDSPADLVQLVGALGYYCFAVLLGLAIHVGVTYPVLLRLFTPIQLRHFFPGIVPAQLVAFSTSSSAATLPVTMKSVEQNLGVSREISAFVLPLGATINMDGTALYQAVAAVFIAQTLGIPLDLWAQLTIILMAVLASIGTAAVPSAGIVMLVIILESVNIPVAGIALILGVDRILDMCRTAANVTGDAAVASIVAASENQLFPPTRDE
ncbi:MAG: dicarboxylate/amino acid:cation symporter [Acidobacteria bacterium]|nr:dicarboxylate/amino acid:cation symporter [Acidobacteriota bacterium]